MIVELGFIYGLRNPLTGEIFYIGSTECSLKNRLRTHYQHLKEFEKGQRKENKRYLYLQNLRPYKAEIFLLEIITNNDIEEKEKFFIKHFRTINPNLTNMTDGGRGNHTSKYYTEKEMEIFSSKISKSNKGKPKPAGFAENMSASRKGLNNPAARPMKIGALVCFKDNEPIKMFKHSFEIDEFIGKPAASAVLNSFRYKPFKPYGYTWKKLSECTREIQDIVQSDYENNQYNQAGFNI